MNLSAKAQKVYNQIYVDGNPKLGDLRKIAKEIKKDHELAKELWSSGKFHARMLAILIMEVKELDENAIDEFFDDMQSHSMDERNQLADWFMANQLTKNKRTIEWMKTWQNEPSALKRRIFWYYQGRLRWTGQKPPENTGELLGLIEKKMATEKPEVQWAMNFTAGWIGIFDLEYRDQCIQIGESLGLYKDEHVPKNCTPNYLPKFIEIEAAKRKL